MERELWPLLFREPCACAREAREKCVQLQPRSLVACGPGLRALCRLWEAIERGYGNAGAFAGGPNSLPNWARRQKRARFWVWGKPLINAAHIFKKTGLMASLRHADWKRGEQE